MAVKERDCEVKQGGYGCQVATLAAVRLGFMAIIRQKYRQHAQQRQEGADLIHILDAGMVGNDAKHRGSQAAHTESEAEEKPGNHADPSR